MTVTIRQLKQATDRRFVSLDRRLKRRFDKIDRRFEQIDRRFEQIDRRFEQVDRRFEQVDRRFERLEKEIARSAAETRRHMGVIAESLRDDLRLFADAIAGHTARLDNHDIRLARLERRTN